MLNRDGMNQPPKRKRYIRLIVICGLVFLLIVLLSIMTTVVYQKLVKWVDQSDTPEAREFSTKCEWEKITYVDVDPALNPEVVKYRLEVDSIQPLPSSLPPTHEVHLTIVNRKVRVGTDYWLSWSPSQEDANRVGLLILMGTFSEEDRNHFCTLFPNARTIYPLPLISGDDR